MSERESPSFAEKPAIAPQTAGQILSVREDIAIQQGTVLYHRVFDTDTQGTIVRGDLYASSKYPISLHQSMGEYQSTLTGDPKTDLVNVHRADRENVVMVDRTTPFGNPFRLKEDGGRYTREESVEQYREWFTNKIRQDPEFRDAVEELRGETLGCWCTPKACHGDVIVEYLRGQLEIEDSDLE